MKEDILEQLVEDYLQFKGFFTIHNVKFKPAETAPGYLKRHDCVASDIDIVGIHPLLKGKKRVCVVSCKAWQGGFDPKMWIAAIEGNKKISGRQAWKAFREIVKRKWANALIAEISKVTGTKSFTYITAVTLLKGEASAWETYRLFQKNLRGNPIRVLTLQEMLDSLYSKTSTTLAGSEIGRLLQVIKASRWLPNPKPGYRS
jgi:hypothetical protein